MNDRKTEQNTKLNQITDKQIKTAGISVQRS